MVCTYSDLKEGEDKERSAAEAGKQSKDERDSDRRENRVCEMEPN